MMCSKTCKEKVKKIQSIVEHDVSNGRAIQKKVRAKMAKNGLKPEKFIEALKSLKEKD